MWHSLQVKWWTMKRMVLKTKWAITRVARMQILHTKMRVIKLNRRRREAKRKAMKGMKNAVLPSVPGVSKLKLPQPPVPHLTRSNTPPTDHEISLARAAVQEAQEEKECMRKRLILRMLAGESTRTWEAATRHKIGRATKFIRQHQGIISPIRRLPPELLEEIFLFTTSFRSHSRWTTHHELPWKLAQVCQSWRKSALAMSSLWSHIPAIALKKSRSRTMRQLNSLEEMLKRSREAPLTLYVYARAYDIYSHPVLDLLAKHCERWHNVTFEVSRNLLASLESIKGRLPTLETLSLQMRFGELDTRTDMFEVAPRLRDVFVSGASSGELEVPIALPYSQLVVYKERLMSRELITQVISSPSSSLESLTILELADGPTMPPVTLPNLLKLSIKFYYAAENPFLSNLTLPLIEELRVVSYRSRLEEFSLVETIITMLSNSKPCNLKDLAFRSDGEDAGALSRLLKIVPNLVSLDATMPPTVDILNLANGYEGRPLVSRLETCKFHGDVVFEAETANALNLLATARCEMVSDAGASGVLIPGEIRSLTHLSVYFDTSEWSHVIHARLQGWKTGPGSIALKLYKMQLYHELPELEFGKKPRGRRFDIKWSDRVMKVLDAIHDHEVEDVNDIYHSELHHCLKRLSDWNLSLKGSFGERAKNILAKWEPLFRENLSTRRWAFKGRYCLVYIPQRDPIRTSPEAMEIIYGLGDSLPFITIFWPMYMSY